MSNNKEFEPILGIDLGSANSACAVYMNGVPSPIPNEIGIKTTNSCISFRSSDEKDWVVGNSAYEGLGLEYEYNVSYVKRIIGLNKEDKILQDNLNNKEIFPFGYKFDEKERVKILIKTPKKYEDYGKNLEKLKKEDVEELEFYPEQISALVLKKLKDNAEKFLQKEIKKAVITVPAYFHDNQREATKNAGKLAGLDVIKMINEPTSAALAYGINVEKNTNENYLVFDLGAGTFDVTILNIAVDENGSKEFNIRGTSGENALGGRDFDKKLIEHIYNKVKESLKNRQNSNLNEELEDLDKLSEKEKNKLKEKLSDQTIIEVLPNKLENYEIDFYNDFNLNNRIKMASELAKIRLSYNETATIDLETISLICNTKEVITQKQFENWNENLFEKCMDVIKKLLTDSKIDKSKIKNVILIGGASRMPKMQEKIKNFFGLNELFFRIDPEEAVCMGAAIQGAIVAHQIDYKISDIDLFDIIPFNFGIELEGGKMDVIIKKYSRFPIIEKNTFKNPMNRKANVSIKVYEGNNEIAKKNMFVGKFLIPIEARGIITVSFEIDINSILYVKATNENKSEKKEMIIINDKAFTKNELEKLKIEGNISNNYMTIPTNLIKLKKNYLAEKNEKEMFKKFSEYIQKYEEFINNIKTDNIENNNYILDYYTIYLKDIIEQYSKILNYTNYIKDDFIKHCKEFLGKCFDKIIKIPNVIIYQYIQCLLLDENKYKKDIYSFCTLFVAETFVNRMINHFNKNEIFMTKHYCHEILRKLQMFGTKQSLFGDYLNRYKNVMNETKKYSIGVKVKNYINIGYELYKKGVKNNVLTKIRYFQDSIFFFDLAEKLLVDIKYKYEGGSSEWNKILNGKSMQNYVNYKNNKISKDVYEKNRKEILDKLKDYGDSDINNLKDIKTIDDLFDECGKNKNYKPFLENILNTLPLVNENRKMDKNIIAKYDNNKLDVLKKFQKYLNPVKWLNNTEEEKKIYDNVTRYSAYINNLLQLYDS